MGRRPGTGLNRDAVLRAAIAVVEEEGADALGTARVAARLGIRPASVYHHVDGNEALRLEVAVEGWRRLVASLPAPTADADATLRAFAWAYRAFALANPRWYAVMTRAPFDPAHPELLAVTASAARALVTLDLPGDELLHAIRGLRAVVHGFVALELAGQMRLAVPPEASFGWLLDRVVPAFAARPR
jgi:AcrR family transcriptional regulator